MTTDPPDSPEYPCHDPRRAKRLEFHHTLARLAPGEPEAVLDALCRAWVDATGADWAWLWLYNAFAESSKYELNVAVSREGPPVLPAVRPRPSDRSLGAYVAAVGREQFVPDIRGWSGTLPDGRVCRVEMADELERLGARSVCCVPLLRPGRADSPVSADDRYTGMITLHFRGPVTTLPTHDEGEGRASAVNGESSLVLMGRVTAQAIARLRQNEQVRITRELNRLAERTLPRTEDHPRAVRTEYAENLLKLIQACLHVRGVSIFCRVPAAGHVACIASTGLRRVGDGKFLLKRDWPLATYAHHEGWTGEVFATGRHMLRQRSHHEGHRPKFAEIFGSPAGDPQSSVLLYPITTSIEGDDKRREVVGVVRCSYLESRRFAEQLLEFDAVGLATLEFIVDQIGPVLHTLEARILREDAVSVVKHDLLAPVAAIRHAIQEVEDSGGRDVSEVQLANLLESAMSLTGLVDSLARNYRQRLEVRRGKVLVEGQIIARLKRMLTPLARDTSDMEIKYDGFAAIPALNIDRRLIERAVYNLVMNAIKYGTRGTTIRIDGSAVDGGYAIDVSNDGIGVLPEEAPNLFSLYYRSPRAASTRQGVGLGLALVKQIMEAHGGTVVLLQPSEPTVFRLFFPARLRA